MMQRSISLTDYLDYNYKHFVDTGNFSAVQKQDLAEVLDRNNGSDSDFRVAQQILSLDSGPRRFTLRFAREYTANAAKQNNLVLIGSQESNPWVGLFADKLNFSLQYDPMRHRSFVTNHAPQAGEQAIYSISDVPNSPTTGLAVIAYLPGVSGKGKVLILEGTDSQATGAAGEFMTAEDSMAVFENKFPPGPIPAFEILLRTSQLSGTPLHAEIAAYRIHTGANKASVAPLGH